MKTFFKDKHIEELRKMWGSFERIDPASPSHINLIRFLDGLPLPALHELMNADIKFVSMLAKNRVRGFVKREVEA